MRPSPTGHGTSTALAMTEWKAAELGRCDRLSTRSLTGWAGLGHHVLCGGFSRNSIVSLVSRRRTSAGGPTYDYAMTTPEQPLSDERISVAVTVELEPRFIAAIEAVDDRVDVRYEPDGSAGADVVFGIPDDTPQGLADVIRAEPGPQWVQAVTGAANRNVRAAGLGREERERVTITGVAGADAAPLAEFAMLGVLGWAKRLPDLLAKSRSRNGGSQTMNELAGQTLLVVGLDRVGAEVARLGKAFGMEVFAITRTGNGHAANTDMLRPSRFLGDLLPVAHAVVVTLALTEATENLIGAQAIDRMRADAVVVGIGDGGVINEDALVRGLEAGRPAAALLDAFAVEPLPADSRVRSLPNALVSPHSVGRTPQTMARIIDGFTTNLGRYLRGDALIDTVAVDHDY